MSLKSRIIEKIMKWLNELMQGRTVPDSTPKQPDNPTPKQPDAPASVGVDALPWDTIHWQGGNHSRVGRDALPVKILRSVAINGNLVRLDYDTISDWEPMTHDEGGGDVWQSYGRLCGFTTAIDGALRGAHFDWLTKDAKVKDLKNVYDGYLFNPPPPRGCELYFAIVSNDGKKRTNLVKGVYK